MRSAAPFHVRKTKSTAPIQHMTATVVVTDRTGWARSCRWPSHSSRNRDHEMASLRRDTRCDSAMSGLLTQVRGYDLAAQPVSHVLDATSELDATLLEHQHGIGVIDDRDVLLD